MDNHDVCYERDCYEVRILQSHTTITFIQSQGHKDQKSTFIIKH